MNDVLVDTSIIVDFLRQKNKESSLLYKLSLKNKNLSISILTHTELYAGKSVWEQKSAKQELEKVMHGLSVVNMNKAISTNAGYIKANYGIDLIDSIIAASAIHKNSILATINIKHFTKIKELKIYKA